MENAADNTAEFEFDEQFGARSVELLDLSQALQFAEGFRLGSALQKVHEREYARIARKYGKDHARAKEMSVRVQANELARKTLLARYTAATTPRPSPGEGWAVDGFVRRASGEPAPGVTVAAYDSQECWQKDFGYACTDDKGYFSLIVNRIPDGLQSLYLRPSKGRRLIESNEPLLSPAPKSAERVEIIIKDTDGKGDCAPPSGGKREPRPPEQSPDAREKPGAPLTNVRASAGASAKEPIKENELKKKTTLSATKAKRAKTKKKG
jgi:hypothetical protein